MEIERHAGRHLYPCQESHYRKLFQPPAPTVTGLARVLGVERRDLVGYRGGDRYIRRAMARIEEYLEERAYGPQATGFVFGLKNNFGWQEKGVEIKIPSYEGRRIRDLSNDELHEIIQKDKDDRSARRRTI